MKLTVKCELNDLESRNISKIPGVLRTLRGMMTLDAEMLTVNNTGKTFGIEIYNSSGILLKEEGYDSNGQPHE